MDIRGNEIQGRVNTSEERLIALQVRDRDKAEVSRDLIAFLEKNNVTGDEILGRDYRNFAVTNHSRYSRELEPLKGKGS